MRIGIDLKYIRNSGRGGNIGDELVQRRLLRDLPPLDPENDYVLYVNGQVDLTSFAGAPQRRVEIRRMPSCHTNPFLRNTLTLPAELKRRPVDLFHGSASLPFCAPGKKVMTMWEFSPLLYPQYFPASVVVTRGFMYRTSVKRADCIVTGTEFMKKEITAYFRIPAERVRVIPIGVDERFLKRSAAEDTALVRERYGITGDYLLAVGDLYPKKNLGRLIEAVNRLKDAGAMDAELLVVGSPLWKTGQLKRLDTRHVRFTGFVPDEHLPTLYQGAKAFVYPSLYEGFGIPVLEAMASGVPMALSNNTAFPETARGAAVYFDPLDVGSIADAVFRILTDAKVREELVREGAQRIAAFQWQEILMQYRDLYHSLCR